MKSPSDFPDFAQFLVEEGIDSISVTPDSLIKTVRAIHQEEAAQKQPMSDMTFLFIRHAGRNIRLDPQRILYIEARKNYSWLVTTEKNFTVLTPLKDWLLFLPQDSFCRIHRSYIVNLEKIASFDSRSVCLQNKELPIGEQYKGELEKKLTIVGGQMGNRHTLNDSSSSKIKLQHTA